MPKRRYLTTSDVARICQVTAVTVGNWIRSAKLKASRVPGGNYRISHDDLISFLQQADMPVPPALTGNHIRLLIIEHDQSVVRRISDILSDKKQMWDIDVAADCFTAGAKVVENEPDLVIVNVLMQGIAPDVCKRVKQTSAWKQAKVIALVVPEQPASLAKAQMLAPDCCLPHAFTTEQLRSAIFALLFAEGSPAYGSPSGDDTDTAPPPSL